MATQITSYCTAPLLSLDPWADFKLAREAAPAWTGKTWPVTFEDALPLGDVLVEQAQDLGKEPLALVSDGVTAPRVGRVCCERCRSDVALEVHEAAMRLWRRAERSLDRATRERLAPDIAGDPVDEPDSVGTAMKWLRPRLRRWFESFEQGARTSLTPFPAGGSVPAPLCVVVRSEPDRLVVTTPKGLTQDEAVEQGATEIAARLRGRARAEQGAEVEQMQRAVATERDTIIITRQAAREVAKKRQARGGAARARGVWVELLGPEPVAASQRVPGFAIPFMRPTRGHPAKPEQRVADRVLELLGWSLHDRRPHVLADVLLVKASGNLDSRRKAVAAGSGADPDQHRRVASRRKQSAR
jgi:hypothetical protein